jgi:hypothetical protein
LKVIIVSVVKVVVRILRRLRAGYIDVLRML